MLCRNWRTVSASKIETNGPAMNFSQAVTTVLTKKYADFSGRARRSEFWWYYLFGVIVAIVAELIDRAIGAPILSIIAGLALIVPNLAVGVRRLHDTSRTGWWLLIGLIPVVGTIILIVFFCQDSHTGTNKYGASPKYSTPTYGNV
jgi:uncharacterized membrane protein YhaH (DUF805 family)